MKPRVYIETSVISYLTSRPSRDLVVAAHQEVTRQWWEERSDKFDLVIAELVLIEAEKGDSDAANARLTVLKSLPLVPATQAAQNLAEKLLADHLVPQQASADALHIALAATNGIEFLLTWNCKHLANALLRKRITAIIDQEGYEYPVICTPDELLEINP